MSLPGPATLEASELPTQPLASADQAIEVDASYIPGGRARMLAARFALASATSGLHDAAGACTGYAMALPQPGLSIIGPVVAASDEQARALIAPLLSSANGPVRLDVPLQHEGLRSWLRACGLREVKVRPEMALGTERLPWQAPQRYALATQAWG